MYENITISNDSHGHAAFELSENHFHISYFRAKVTLTFTDTTYIEPNNIVVSNEEYMKE